MFHQINVSQIDHRCQALPQDEHRISAVDRVDQEKRGAAQREIPESHWEDTGFRFFRSGPLRDKSHEKETLGGESKNQPPIHDVPRF
jgi:hypothetical protein